MSQYCPNCKTVLQYTDQYCSSCGQRNSPLFQSLWGYITSFTSQVFNTDGSLLTTLRHLLQPSKVAIAYMQGERKKYLHPFRLLIILSSILAIQSLSKRNHSYYDLQQHMRTLDSIEARILRVHDSLDVAGNQIDTAYHNLIIQLLHEKDSITKTPLIIIEKDGSASGETTRIALRDLNVLSNRELAKTYNITSIAERIQLVGFRNFIRNPDQLLNKAISNAIWAFIITLPLVALILRTLFRRRYPYITQHLTFIAFTLSFIIIISNIGILFHTLTAISPTIPILILASTYTLFSIKDFYVLRWWQSILLGLLLFVLLAILMTASLILIFFVIAFLV